MTNPDKKTCKKETNKKTTQTAHKMFEHFVFVFCKESF